LVILKQKSFFVYCYRLSLWVYHILIGFAAPYRAKAKLWLEGRKNIFQRIERALAKNQHPLIWFHCASLGEYEQAVTLIHLFQKNRPGHKIFLTFFSPSGFTQIKKDSSIDFVFYLPMDSPENSQHLIRLVQPDLAVFIKYEFWYFYLHRLQEENIPVILVAGVFRKNQLFFKPWGKTYLKVIKNFTHIFVQDESSAQLLEKYAMVNVTVTGDPRVDRVKNETNNLTKLFAVAEFKGDSPVFIVGSAHRKEEKLFITFLKSIKKYKSETRWKFLIAPHELKKTSLQKLRKELGDQTAFFSEWNSDLDNSNIRILILDTIGHLRTAYAYGDFCLIGGGFDQSVHNILEPAAYGLPICFGPRYHKFREAVQLVESGGAFCIHSARELFDLFCQFQDTDELKRVQKINRAYIENQLGASQKVFNSLCEKNII